MRRWLLLSNVRAGQKRREAEIAAVVTELAERGIEVATDAPPSREATIARARAAARDHEAVLALGGDGTVAVVAAGLAGTDAALGILPSGTVNVLARELGIPLDPLRAARVLATAEPRPLDIGRVTGANGLDERFLLMASVGTDAEIMRDVPSAAKRRWGRGAIVGTAIRKLLREPLPRFEVTVDGGAPIEAMLAVVASCRFYGGQFAVAPEADPSDGLFDLVLLPPGSRSRLFRFFLAMPWGGHLRIPGVRTARGRRFELRPSAGAPAAAVQIDGDPLGDLPVTVAAAGESVRVLVPRS